MGQVEIRIESIHVGTTVDELKVGEAFIDGDGDVGIVVGPKVEGKVACVLWPQVSSGFGNAYDIRYEWDTPVRRVEARLVIDEGRDG